MTVEKVEKVDGVIVTVDGLKRFDGCLFMDCTLVGLLTDDGLDSEKLRHLFSNCHFQGCTFDK